MKRVFAFCLSVFALFLFCPSAFADNESAEPLKIAGGTYEVGDDIPAGKYAVSVVSGFGYLTVFDSYEDYLKAEGDRDEANISYFLDADGTHGTQNVGLLHLNEGMFVSNQNASTIFTAVTKPVAEEGTNEKFVVYPGVYVVGEDFPAGKFSAEVVSGFGYFSVFQSYEKYLEAEGYAYDALETHFLDEDGKHGATEIGSFRLADGMYVTNQGATINVTPK